MQRGVVMEITKRYMIVLTKDGEFIRAELNFGADIGEEVLYSKIPLYSFPHFFNQKLYSVPFVFLLVFLITFPIPNWFESNKAYGVVSLDLNSTIELAVDRNYEVLSMNGYNKTGEELVNSMDSSVEGKTLGRATTLLLKEGIKLGIIKSLDSIFISSSVDFDENSNWGTNFYSWSSSIVNEYGFVIYPIYVETEVSEQAKQLSISPIKYVLLAQHEDEIDFSNMTNTSISTIEKEVGKSVTNLEELVFLSDHNENISP
ncbi:anti-sigma factor domain-containing protein [Salipaludibacillus sp. CF4.18]|uniref:anti-sigma factor domain-containing protein n=1 Tax=Salipaludibacillus sp. CF4.18 TaxID=3373081 RepID=UPI003F4C89EB